MFNKSSDIIKYIEENIKCLFKITHETDDDEELNEYINDYKEELSSFYSRLDYNLKTLESNNVFLGFQEIYNAILINWDFSEDDDMSEVRNFVNKLLENVYCTKKKITKPLITNKELISYVHSLMHSEMQKNMDILVALMLNKKENYWVDFLDKLKKIDNEHRLQMIDNIVSDYIKACNSIYTLTGKNPVNSETLHEGICKHFSIKRKQFMF